MQQLQLIDESLFRFVNQSLANPLFDLLMPHLAGHPAFLPAVALATIVLLWKGGTRGRLFVVFLLLAVILGDTLVLKTLKEAVGRVRPCAALPDAILRIGPGGSGSMPSSHAANWFAATMVAFIYYRRIAVWFLLPMASLVSFSRVYDGVHYPADVIAGAILGAGYAAALVWTADAIWKWAGPRWFLPWWTKLPSFLDPALRVTTPATDATEARRDPTVLWLRLGYVVIAVLLVARLGYINSGEIELSEDEAYQWVWSKHLALSYYSKPLLIACTQWLGTHIWGDTELGVRFFSPVIAALLSVLLLRFFAREVNARAGFWLLLTLTATPLMGVGSILMTVDPLLVLFWVAALLAAWKAVQPDGTTRQWAWVGLWIGLGFLSKYTAALQWVCLAIYLAVVPSARVHLRRPGPWLALGITALCTLPVVIWNAQHDWISATHVADNAQLREEWHYRPGYMLDFTLIQFALLNPVFFAATLWALVAFWKRPQQRPLLVFLFCMGAPLFLGHWLYTIRARVHPNWIAASVVPMLCVATVYWDQRWREGSRRARLWLVLGLALGLPVVIVAHKTDVIRKFTGHRLPPQVDPLRRVRGSEATMQIVEAERQRLLQEGKPVFIICDHYGLTGQLSFYHPDARERVRTDPLVYYQTSEHPDNQFYFWPGYRHHRKGDNAIYVHEIDLPKLRSDWVGPWLRGEGPLTDDKDGNVLASPRATLLDEFEGVEDLGVFRAVDSRGRHYRSVQLFACRNLR